MIFGTGRALVVPGAQVYGAGQGGGWSPNDIAGLVWWVDAASITGLVDGDPVATWTDKSASLANVTAAAAARPTYKTNILNSKPVVRFNGSANVMATANSSAPASAQPTSMFIVGNFNATNDVMIDAVTNLTHQIDRPTTPGAYRMYAGASLQDTNDDSSTHVFLFNFNGATSKIWVDGVLTTTGNAGAGALAGVTLGNRGGGGPYFLDGDLAEICIYNSTLSQINRDLVVDYLAARWGITVPQSVIFDGDSLTSGYQLADPSTQSYPAQTVALFTPARHAYNFGVPAQYIDAMTTDGTTQIDPLFYTGKLNVVCNWGGGNNIALGNQTAATVYPKLVTYNAARKAAGFTVIQLTFPPRVDIEVAGGWEAERVALNANIVANGAGADYVADVAANANLSDYTNLTYFQADQIHLTAAGYAVVAGIVKTEIDKVV